MSPTDQDAYFGRPDLFTPRSENPWDPFYDEVHISVAFTWDVEKAMWLKEQWEAFGVNVKVGGPAINGEGDKFTPGMYLKRGAVITSRGCPNSCPWCFIKKPLKELCIHQGNNILDNNILACSPAHLDKVFSMLGSQHYINFSGGLEASRVTDEISERLRGLNIKQLFLAYDDQSRLGDLKKAVNILSKYFKREYIRCFVLIGFKESDTITKARDRLIKAWEIGTIPFAMLYRNKEGSYPVQDIKQWRKLQKYWSRPAYIKKMAKNSFNDTLDIL